MPPTQGGSKEEGRNLGPVEAKKKIWRNINSRKKTTEIRRRQSREERRKKNQTTSYPRSLRNKKIEGTLSKKNGGGAEEREEKQLGHERFRTTHREKWDGLNGVQQKKNVKGDRRIPSVKGERNKTIRKRGRKKRREYLEWRGKNSSNKEGR